MFVKKPKRKRDRHREKINVDDRLSDRKGDI